MISFSRTPLRSLREFTRNRVRRGRSTISACPWWFCSLILAFPFLASTTGTTRAQTQANPTELQKEKGIRETRKSSEQSQVIQSWDFGRDEDPNKEQRPVQFKRRKGRDYPPYLPATIVPRHPENKEDAEAARRTLARYWIAYSLKRWPWEVVPETVPPAVDRFLETTMLDPCLEIQMDGGSVEMQAPIFPIEGAFSYAFEIAMESQGLDGHNAYAEMVFLDANQNVVNRKSTKTIHGTSPWKSLRVGPIAVEPGVVFGQIRIIVVPNQRIAVKGKVHADRIRVVRMPQLSVALNNPIHLYRVGDPIEVNCMASGLLDNIPNIDLHLVDQDNTEIERASIKIDRRQRLDTLRSQSKLTSTARPAASLLNRVEPVQGWQGQARWEIPSLPPGFYTLRCTLSQTQGFTRDASFCVLPKETGIQGDKRFGWSLGQRSETIPVRSLPSFLELGCIRGFKIPIWLTPEDHRHAEEQSWLIERLKGQGVDLIGVLDAPPKEDERFFSRPSELTPDAIWEQENIWRTLLIPVLSRSCLELNEFQIGWDNETIFTGNPNLYSKVSSLQSLIELYGPNSKLHIPWSALEQPNKDATAPMRDFHFGVEPPWTAQELTQFVGFAQQSKIPFSINLQGIPLRRIELASTESTLTPNTTRNESSGYSLEEALQHLTDSMLASIQSGVEKTWIGNALDVKQGWLQANGGPGLMFLPFRNLSMATSEKEYLGKLPVPNDSTCHVLASDDGAAMILVNNRPTREELYFGENVRANDLFGRAVPVVEIDGPFGKEQAIDVGPRPIIVHGVDIDVAQWAMGIQILNPIIETTLSGRQSLKIEFANPTSSPIRGTIRVVAPNILNGESTEADFKLDAQGKKNVSVDLSIRPDATSQKTRVRIDVEVKGRKEVRFSVYRDIKIGQDDIELEIQQSIDEYGNLLLQLEFLNHTGRTLRFDCLIEIPNRPREKKQILDLEERAERVVGLRNAAELVGETIWVRCQDMDSVRVVNQRIVVRPK